MALTWLAEGQRGGKRDTARWMELVRHGTTYIFGVLTAVVQNEEDFDLWSSALGLSLGGLSPKLWSIEQGSSVGGEEAYHLDGLKVDVNRDE